MLSAARFTRTNLTRPGVQRFVLPSLAAAVMLCSPCVSRAAGADLIDVQLIQQLETKASIATPREQCYLYTELVQRMTELASKQFSTGQADEAVATLKKIAVYADRIQMGVADDSKKLKKAEILLRETDRRLIDVMHNTSEEDRNLVQTTLKRLKQVHTELLTAIFRH